MVSIGNSLPPRGSAKADNTSGVSSAAHLMEENMVAHGLSVPTDHKIRNDRAEPAGKKGGHGSDSVVNGIAES